MHQYLHKKEQVWFLFCHKLLCKITDNSGTLRKEDYEAYHKEVSGTVGVQKEIMQYIKEQVDSVARSLLGSNNDSENSVSNSSAMSPKVDLPKSEFLHPIINALEILTELKMRILNAYNSMHDILSQIQHRMENLKGMISRLEAIESKARELSTALAVVRILFEESIEEQ